MEKLELLSGNIILSVFIFLLIVIPLTFVVAVWKRNDLSQTSKIMWMLFFVFAPVFSIFCYLLFGYKRSERR
ncbi:PLDc N-terminal domain-containing protein [Lacibacter sp.]|uniref:PLDc N-terminal domain-containing protein n=1 Tax=Lacibacter sp. TaxID=1915409 RepID=UPI0039C9B228